MSFWYLATPYSKYPEGLTAAFVMACRQTGVLMKARIPVYSPIAHGHSVGLWSAIDPLDHGIWLPADQPMMEAASGLIVVKAPSWELSWGVWKEREYFASEGKPIIYMELDELPKELG